MSRGGSQDRRSDYGNNAAAADHQANSNNNSKPKDDARESQKHVSGGGDGQEDHNAKAHQDNNISKGDNPEIAPNDAQA